MAKLNSVIADLESRLKDAEAGIAHWEAIASKLRNTIEILSGLSDEAAPAKAAKIAKPAKAKKPAAKKAVAKKPAAKAAPKAEAKKEEKAPRTKPEKKLPIIKQADWVETITKLSAETGSTSPLNVAAEMARSLGIKDEKLVAKLKNRAYPALAILTELKKITKVGDGLYAPA